MIKPTLKMMCNEIGPLVSPVIHSQPLMRQSALRDICCALRDLFGKCVFIVVYVHVFLLDKKKKYISASIEHILFFMCILAFPSSDFFFKIGGWKISND